MTKLNFANRWMGSFFVLFSFLLLNATLASAASLTELKFVKKTNLNLEVYAAKAKPDLQVTRQRVPLDEYPFNKNVNFERLGKQFQTMRAMNSAKMNINNYSIDSIAATSLGAEHTLLVLLGSYEISGEKYYFTEIQEIQKKQMITTVATDKGATRPQEDWIKSLHEQMNKKDRQPAADAPDTQGKAVCLECLANATGPIDDLKKSAEEIAQVATPKASPAASQKTCQEVKSEYRKDLVVSLDTEMLHRQEEEEFLEAVTKGSLSCSQRITEQMIQGGWDVISFGGLLIKLGFQGVWGGAKTVYRGLSDLAKFMYSPGERLQMMSAMKDSISEGVKNTSAGLQYLSENSVSGILHSAGQAISEKAKSVKDKTVAMGGMLKTLFKGYIGKQRTVFACLKGREKVDYFCDWAGYAVGLFIPPSIVFKAIKEGAVLAKMEIAGSKAMQKYLVKAGEKAEKVAATKSSDAVVDSLKASEALQAGSVSGDLTKAAGRVAAKETRAGEAAFKELSEKSDPREIEAVIKTSELADSPGGIAKAIEEIGQKHAAVLPEGTGKELTAKLCECGFCAVSKKSAQLDFFMSQMFMSANAKIDKGCAAVALQVQDLLKPVEGLLKDAEKGKTAMYWGRLRNTFEAVDNKVLESVVQKIKAEDLEPIFWAIKSGEVKVNRVTEEFFEHLYHFTDDASRAEIWASKDPVFAIKTKLRERDAMAGFSGEPTVAAELSEQAMRVSESQIIARVVGETMRGAKYENSKWYDGVRNFFSPLHDRLETVIKANNDIRKSFQIMYKADEPVTDALSRYGAEVSEGSLAEIRGLVTDTSTRLAESRKNMQTIYGKELSAGAPLKEADVKIREIAKRASNFLKAGGDAKGNTLAAGKDMDRLGEIIEGVWKDKHANDAKWIKEKNLEVHPEYGYYRPAGDLHPTDLQIQNPKMRGETSSLRDAYYNTTQGNVPKKAEYETVVSWNDNVTYTWSETKKRLKPGTNEEEDYLEFFSKTFSKSRNRPNTLEASFEEALVNKVTPDLDRARINDFSTAGMDLTDIPKDAAALKTQTGKEFSYIDENAIGKILESAKDARVAERPYRETINEVAGRVNGISNSEYQALLAKSDDASLKVMRKQFDSDRAKLVQLKGKLDEYVKTDQATIAKQWKDDKPEIFKDRNREMKDRVDHMIKRISYFDEQVARKQSSLELELKTQDYSKQLEPLKQIRDRNQKIVITGAVVGGTGAAAGAAYAWIPEVKEKVNSVAAEMGIIDKAQKKKAEEKKQNWMK